MDRKFLVLAATLSLLASLSSASETLAQAPEPPCTTTSLPGGAPYRTPEGRWVAPGGTTPFRDASRLAPRNTGGPDEFGYTWDDSVPMNWIDATGGTDTGLSGDSWDQATGAVPLPFPFKYYENTYTEVYIAAGGYLAFTEASFWDDQEYIPSPEQPNNVIAPYWTPTYIGGGSWVRYLSGGTAPNRYFAVEWHNIKGGSPDDTIGRDETYRFEAVLYENGDILFQYQTMALNDSWWCGASGIEDSAGLDGLSYVDFCDQAPSYKAVRFYRPPPSARVSIGPLYQGSFTHAGETATFQIPIRNTGELGTDTFDLLVSSLWTANLYAADGLTPLTDTDWDGTVDTGFMAQGGTTTVVVEVNTPGTAIDGDDNVAAITVRSSLNPDTSKTVSLQTAVPAPFAQVYRDDADGAMSLYLAHPGEQNVSKATSNYHWGYETAVAETPASFVYAWYKSRSTGSSYVSEIEYALLGSDGRTTRPPSRLTDHTGAQVGTYDYSPAVAVAPNGRIGVTWYRYMYNSSTYYWNYNIYYAVLDAAGNVIVPPTNLTNNPYWGSG
jgi:hypothetical protein